MHFVLVQSKENQIRKQFQETVKVQMKQYKAWKNHVMETVPRKEQKDVSLFPFANALFPNINFFRFCEE